MHLIDCFQNYIGPCVKEWLGTFEFFLPGFILSGHILGGHSRHMPTALTIISTMSLIYHFLVFYMTSRIVNLKKNPSHQFQTQEI